MIKDLPRYLETSYSDRIKSIATQAEGLEKSGETAAYCAFVKTALTDSVESFAPQSQEKAYLSMVSAVSTETKDLAGVSQSLWRTALQVVSAGIPGGAGVALAKTAERVGGPLEPEARAQLAATTVDTCRAGYGQTRDESVLHAGIAFDLFGKGLPTSITDAVVLNAVKTIAALESWNIATP